MRADISRSVYLFFFFCDACVCLCIVLGARREKKTYHDDGADEHQVPEEILFPWKLGIRRLQHARVLINKVRIEYDS